MSATKNRPSGSFKKVKPPRRAQRPRPALDISPSPGHADWTCRVCRARGTVQFPAGTTSEEISTRVREQHAIKQPSCEAA